MHKPTKFDLLENCLKQSGLESALGRQQLFFKPDQFAGDGKSDNISRTVSDTINLGERSKCESMFEDQGRVVQVVDLKSKEICEVFISELYKQKTGKKDKVFILSDLSYAESREILEYLSDGLHKYNGIIMWELQMIQNYDKVVQYEKDVSYYNVEIHKQCHM